MKKAKRYTVCLMVLSLSLSPLRGQQMEWDWSYIPGGSGESYAVSFIADPFSNLYALGHFSDLLIIGNDSLQATGLYDELFITKFDTNGLPLFTTLVSCSDLLSRGSVVVDENGNLYLAASYTNEINLHGFTVHSTSLSSGVLASFSPDGVLLWVKEIKTDYAVDGLKLTIDPGNTVHLAGNYYDAISIDSLTSGPHSDHAEHTIHYFIAAFDTQGQCLRLSEATTGSGFLSGLNDIASDEKGNVYVSATMIGLCDLGNGVVIQSEHQTPMVAKYNREGLCQWAKIIHSDVGFAEAFDLSIDKDGGVYQTGMFLSPIYFEKDTLVSPEGTMEDIFLVKYDSSGNQLNAYAYRSNADAGDFGLCFQPGGSGRGYLLGLFGDTLIMGSDTLTAIPDPTSQLVSSNVFMAKIGDDGHPVWGRYAGQNGDRYFGEINLIHNMLYLAGYTFNRLLKSTSESPVKKAFFASADMIADTLAPSDTVPDIIVTSLDPLIQKDLMIYPNPSTGKLTVAGFNGIPGFMYIYNHRGELVFSRRLAAGLSRYTTDISSLENGIYFIRLAGEKYNVGLKLCKF